MKIKNGSADVGAQRQQPSSICGRQQQLAAKSLNAAEHSQDSVDGTVGPQPAAGAEPIQPPHIRRKVLGVSDLEGDVATQSGWEFIYPFLGLGR
jgi:hypothetical protein